MPVVLSLLEVPSSLRGLSTRPKMRREVAECPHLGGPGVRQERQDEPETTDGAVVERPIHVPMGNLLISFRYKRANWPRVRNDGGRRRGIERPALRVYRR